VAALAALELLLLLLLPLLLTALLLHSFACEKTLLRHVATNVEGGAELDFLPAVALGGWLTLPIGLLAGALLDAVHIRIPPAAAAVSSFL